MSLDKNYQGTDVNLETSLEEYGFVARPITVDYADEYFVIYKMDDNQYGSGHIRESELDAIVKGTEWASEEDVNSMLETVGASKEEWFDLSFVNKFSDLVSYWGTENIMGTDYYPNDKNWAFEEIGLESDDNDNDDLVEYIVPTHYVTALLNSDGSGLSFEDIEELAEFVDEVKGANGNANFMLGNDEESYFANRNDINALGSDVMKLYIRPSDSFANGGESKISTSRIQKKLIGKTILYYKENINDSKEYVISDVKYAKNGATTLWDYSLYFEDEPNRVVILSQSEMYHLYKIGQVTLNYMAEGSKLKIESISEKTDDKINKIFKEVRVGFSEKELNEIIKNAKSQSNRDGYDYIIYSKNKELSFARKSEFDRFFDNNELRRIAIVRPNEKVDKFNYDEYSDGGGVEYAGGGRVNNGYLYFPISDIDYQLEQGKIKVGDIVNYVFHTGYHTKYDPKDSRVLLGNKYKVVDIQQANSTEQKLFNEAPRRNFIIEQISGAKNPMVKGFVIEGKYAESSLIKEDVVKSYEENNEYADGGGVERLVGSFYYDTRKDKTFRVISVDGTDRNGNKRKDGVINIGIQYYDNNKQPIGSIESIDKDTFDYYVSMGAWGEYKQSYFKDGGMFEAPIGMMKPVSGKVVGRVPVSEDLLSSEVKYFIDYVYEAYKEYGFTKEQVKKAVNKYLKELGKEYTYGGGDSLDRERVYEFLLNPNLKEIKNPTFADGGKINDWKNAKIGDSARVLSENKMGLIIKDYGRKFHLKFVNGSEKTYDASELEFYKFEEEFAKGGGVEQNLEVGNIVELSESGWDNESYHDFFNGIDDVKLVVTNVYTSTSEHQGFDSGVGMALYSLERLDDGTEVPFDLYDYELEYVSQGDKFAKGGMVKVLDEVKENGIITENQINLIKKRLNSGKDDSELDDLVEYINDNSPKLSNEQNKKGYEFLMNLWKSPTGKERKNSPFGYREESVLENFEYFELAGFYTVYGIGAIPVYNVIGKSSNTSFSGAFKYYYDGKVNIIGADGGMFAKGGGVEERYILKDVEEDETTEFSAEELKEYIADWNNSMETDYEDWKDFNKGEEYYKITPLSRNKKSSKVQETYILKDVEEDETTEFSAEELKEYIADWNNSMETDYEDWKDFNKGEEYYKITPISKHAKGGGVDYKEYRITIYNDVNTPETYYNESKSDAITDYNHFVSQSEKGKLENTGISLEGSNDDENWDNIDWHDKDSFAKGGGVDNVSYEKIYEVLKENIDESIDDLGRTYENSSDFTGEEIEHKLRDGFIPYTNGGYELSWYEYVSTLNSTGYTLPTEKLQAEMQRHVDYSYELAKDNFKDTYPEIVEVIGEDNIDYNSLDEAGFTDEAQELSDWEMEYLSDEDTIRCSIIAYYYEPTNEKGQDGKHTISLQGDINLEAPYHRKGKNDDFTEVIFTFDSMEELKSKLEDGLKNVIDWFNGSKPTGSDDTFAKGGKAKPKAPKIVRTQFEEGEYEYAKGGGVDNEKPYQVYNYETQNIEGYFDNEMEAEEFASKFKNATVYDTRQYAKGGGVRISVLNELYNLKDKGVTQVQLNGFSENIGYVIGLRLDDTEIEKVGNNAYITLYKNGGGVGYYKGIKKEDIISKTIVYDNPETFDRYTVFTPDGSVFGMSENASGFNQYVGEDNEIQKGKHLGRKLKSVPTGIEWAILDRMKEEYADGGGVGKLKLLSDKFTEVGYNSYARNFGVVQVDGKNINILVSAVIHESDNEEFEDKPYEWYIELFAYPQFWSDEYAENIKDMVGDDTINPRSLEYLYDAQSYGYGLPLSTYADDVRFSTTQDAIDFLNNEDKGVNEDISGLGMLSGFHFDKQYNRIGDTGWSLLYKQIGANEEEYARGGGIKSDYYIFEGFDHFNSIPLYQVNSSSENDNEYVGEWHTDKSDAEKELESLNENYAKGGGVDDEEIDDFVYEYGVSRKEAEETLKRRKGRLSPKENLRLNELDRKNRNVGLTLTDSEEIEFDKLVHKYRGWDYKMSKGGGVDVDKVKKGDEIYREHNREIKEKGIEQFSKESATLWDEKYDDRLNKLKLTFEEKNQLNPKNWYADGGGVDDDFADLLGGDVFLLSKGYENPTEVFFQVGDRVFEVTQAQKGLKNIGIFYYTKNFNNQIDKEVLDKIHSDFGNNFTITFYTNAGVDLHSSSKGKYKNIQTERLKGNYSVGGGVDGLEDLSNVKPNGIEVSETLAFGNPDKLILKYNGKKIAEFYFNMRGYNAGFGLKNSEGVHYGFGGDKSKSKQISDFKKALKDGFTFLKKYEYAKGGGVGIDSTFESENDSLNTFKGYNDYFIIEFNGKIIHSVKTKSQHLKKLNELVDKYNLTEIKQKNSEFSNGGGVDGAKYKVILKSDKHYGQVGFNHYGIETDNKGVSFVSLEFPNGVNTYSINEVERVYADGGTADDYFTMKDGSKMSKNEWYQKMEEKLGFEKFAERELKDAQFGRDINAPLNELTHNRLDKKAVIGKNSITISSYTPNYKRHLDSITLYSIKELNDYLNKNQILSNGGGVDDADWIEESLIDLQNEVDMDDLVVENSDNNHYTASNGNAEFEVFETEDDARERAIERVKEDLEENPEYFSKDWLMNYIDGEDFFTEVYNEWNESYANDIESEDSDKYANRLIEEMVENGIVSSEEAKEDGFDAEDYKDAFVELMTSNQMWEDNGLEHYIDNFGEEQAFKVVSDNNLIDIDKASESAVDTDGVAHFLSSYDGEQIDLSNGHVAYRIN